MNQPHSQDSYVDAAYLPTAPDLAAEFLGEHLKRKTDDIESEIGKIALPCGVDICQPGVCGKDFDYIKSCGDKLALGTMVNITNSKDEQAAVLEERVLRDPLFPEFLSRAGLKKAFDRLQAARGPNDKLAMYFLDLDDFKRANDTHGHDFGDTVLGAQLQKLRSAVRDEDAVGRIGGDELVVLADVDGADEEAIKKMVERIRAPLDVEEGENKYTSRCSVGMVFVGHTEDMESALKKADQAMYKAKARRKHGVVLWTGTKDDQHTPTFAEVA
jgi:diguanylate cyclase (GGDEF)-like protein